MGGAADTAAHSATACQSKEDHRGKEKQPGKEREAKERMRSLSSADELRVLPTVCEEWE